MTGFTMLKPEKVTVRQEIQKESDYSYEQFEKVVVKGDAYYFPYGDLNLNFREEIIISTNDGRVRMDLRDCSYSGDKEGGFCLTKLTSDNYRIVCMSLDFKTNIMTVEIKDFKSCCTITRFQLKSVVIRMESYDVKYFPEVTINSI